MKKRIIDHLVNAITKHQKIVIIITLVLCALSMLLVVMFLKTDISIKGLAGNRIEEVNQLDNFMKRFNVSGMTNVTLQPNPEIDKEVYDLSEQYNKLIYEHLDDSQQEKIIADMIAGNSPFNDTDIIINITIDILKLLSTEEITTTINGLNSLSNKDKEIITNYLVSKSDEDRYIIRNRFIQLNNEELNRLISIADKLKSNNKVDIIKITLNYMKLIDKKTIVINNITDNMTEIDLLEEKIETILLDFKKLSENIASELRQTLLSEKKDTINEVLYADEISISKDRLMYLIMIAPKRDISKIKDSKIFVAEVDTVLNALKDKYKDSIRIRRTGYSVLASDEEQTMLNGFWIQMIIVIVGILIIFFIGFKRFVYPILSFIPLSIGVLLMYGFYSITAETLNIITLIAPILLYGVGIDYAIHFGARYGEVRAELGKDAPQSEVLKETFNSIGTGMVVAVLTTIIAFLSFLTSSIEGLFNFAIITSSGVFFSFLSMMYLLPIIVLWRERKFKKNEGNFISSNKFTPLGKLSNSIFGKIISIIIVLIALLFIPFYKGLEIEFEKDAIKMQGLESVELGEELGERFDQSHSQTAFIVKGYDNVVNFEKELRRRENDVSVYPTINASRTINARKAVREFEKFGWDRDITTLDEYKQKYIDKKGESSKIIADLYEFFVRNYVDWEEDDYLVLVNSSGYVWYENSLKAHIKDLKTLEHNTELIGAGVIKVWWFLTSHMVGDLLTFSIISFVIIVIILAFITKSLKGTIICAISLLISCLSTLSTMAIFNIKINFANIPAFAVIMGLGIDYTIHIYYRLVHESHFDTINAISSTGKAVLLTTLTTLVSFGAVAFSVHRGISSLGLIISIGLIMCFLSSLFLIPTLVKIFYRKQYGNHSSKK